METNLSRRGFLTGAAAAGALAAMGLAGCAPTPAAEGGTKTADTGAAAATSWRDKPEMPTEFVETVDADIVVVGAGNGALWPPPPPPRTARRWSCWRRPAPSPPPARPSAL